MFSLVAASFLYSDGDGFHFLDQETYETLTLTEGMIGDAMDFIIAGSVIQLRKYNGNPIGLELPPNVELVVEYTEPAVKGDTSGGATKIARLEMGLEIRVPLFHQRRRKGHRFDWRNEKFAGRA